MEHKLVSDKNAILRLTKLLTILTQVLYYQIDIRFLMLLAPLGQNTPFIVELQGVFISLPFENKFNF